LLSLNIMELSAEQKRNIVKILHWVEFKDNPFQYDLFDENKLNKYQV